MKKARFRIEYRFAGMTEEGPQINTVLIAQNYKACKLIWRYRVEKLILSIVDTYIITTMFQQTNREFRRLQQKPLTNERLSTSS